MATWSATLVGDIGRPSGWGALPVLVGHLAGGLGQSKGLGWFGLAKDAGWVNLPEMTDAIKHKLEQEARFKKAAWSMSDGVPDDFDLVISCRGVGAKQELNNLGFKLAADHGEVLTIDVGGLSLNNTTLNRVKWLMPFEGHFKLGATYEWSVENSVPTEAGKKELIDAISPALAPEVADQISIINHQSGLRPAALT